MPRPKRRAVDRASVLDDLARVVEADIAPDSIVGRAIERLRVIVPLLLISNPPGPDSELDELMHELRRVACPVNGERFEANLSGLHELVIEARTYARWLASIGDAASLLDDPPEWLGKTPGGPR